MAFDPSQPYDVVGTATAEAPKSFDPNQAFEVVGRTTPQFDPNQPHEFYRPPPSSTPATDDATDPFQGSGAPNLATNLGDAIASTVKALPQMLIKFPQYAYHGAKIASGQEHMDETLRYLVEENAPQAAGLLQGIRSPVGSKPFDEAVIQLGMMAAPGLDLVRGFRGIERPPIQVEAPPVQVGAVVRGVEPSVPSQRPGVSGEAVTGAPEPGGGPVPPSGVQGMPVTPEVPVVPEAAAEAAQAQGTPEMARVQPEVGVVSETRPTISPERQALLDKAVAAGRAKNYELMDAYKEAADNLKAAEPTGAATATPEAAQSLDQALTMGAAAGAERHVVLVDGSEHMVAPFAPIDPDGSIALANGNSVDRAVIAKVLDENKNEIPIGEQYASSQQPAAEVGVRGEGADVGPSAPLRQPGETAPVQGDVGGGAAQPKAQEPITWQPMGEGKYNVFSKTSHSKVELDSQGNIRLRGVSTAPEARGTGQGRNLIERIINEAPQQFPKAKEIVAWAFPDAEGFWKKLGFKATGETVEAGDSTVSEFRKSIRTDTGRTTEIRPTVAEPKAQEAVGPLKRRYDVEAQLQPFLKTAVEKAKAEAAPRAVPVSEQAPIGVAERYAQEEVPGSVVPGTRQDASYWKAKGREYINQGGDPRMPIRAADAGHVSPRNVGIVSAEHERLVLNRRAAADALEANPRDPVAQKNYEAADAAARAWRQEMQPVLTRAGESLGAAIGQEQVDLGTFDGLHEAAMEANGGQPLTIAQKADLMKRAGKAREYRQAEAKANGARDEVINKTLPKTKPLTPPEMLDMVERMKARMTPCR